MASTMMKLTPIALAVLLTGCGTIGNAVRSFDEPTVTKPTLKVEETLKEPSAGAIAVAVYSFRDMTGQRKASQNIASLSSAVTQGADAYLVKSLQEVGGGRWFKVLERGGLDNLVKERQLIRQMRELYQGKDAQPLPPMMFAGMILEGGIIGYDSNTMSGGSGARFLGIGASTEYRQDEVTVSLRAVSVATGEVLVAVNTNKKVFSFQDKLGVLRFVDAGTQALELETGSATNESMNKAVQLAIHAAVVELINSGARKGHWSFKSDIAVQAPRPEPVAVKEEVKKEEVVQKDPAPKEEKSAAPAAVQSDDKKDSPKEQPASESKNTDTNTVNAVQPKVTLGNVTDWVYVRKERNSNSERLVNLRPGTQVEVLDTKGDHYVVKFNGKEGYVAKKFIKVQQ